MADKYGVKVIRLGEVPDESREGGGYSIKRLVTESLKTGNPGNVGFYQTSIPAGSRVKNHYHERLDEFLYFTTTGKVRVDSTVYELNPGDILVLPPRAPHEIFAEQRPVILIAVKIPNIPDDKVNI